MAAYDLIAFDLDGTVFSVPFKQEVTERVSRAFQQAREHGVAIAVATGRPVAMLGEQLAHAPWLDWAITANGSGIVDMQGNQPALHRPIAKQTALALMSELGDKVSWSAFIDETPYVEEKKVLHMAEYGLGAFADSKTGTAGQGIAGANTPRNGAATCSDTATCSDASSNNSDAPCNASIMERFGFNPIEAFASRTDMNIVPSIYELIESLPQTSNVQKISCALDAPDGTEATFANLTRDHKDLDIAILNATELEITSAGVNKGSSLELLCWKLGIEPSRAVAFGDSGNDISMTGRANRFVAMGNADAFIKERADEVTATVQEDGVALWIERNLL